MTEPTDEVTGQEEDEEPKLTKETIEDLDPADDEVQGVKGGQQTLQQDACELGTG